MAGYLHPSSAGQKTSATREPLRRSISISFSTRPDESKKPPLKDESAPQRYSRDNLIPTHDINHLGFRVTTGIAPDGESGRTGINPIRFISICWKSSSDASQAVNFLWPIVPVAIMVTYTQKDYHTAIFVLNYLSMIPSANLIGFAGQELSRKLDKVFGILLETTLGSVVEIVMFIVLLMRHEYQVIQAAILGSILATQLLCLGMCFFIGGLSHDEQVFDEEISEVGSDLLLQA
jgi:Ca2+:H+ antiporter